MNPICDYFCS